MTAAKKKTGALPVAVVPKKLTRKEKHVINAKRHRDVQAAVKKQVWDWRASSIANWPRKKENASRLAPGRQRHSPVRDIPYTDELDEKLFILLSVGTSLDTIASLEGMPELYVLLGWLAKSTHRLNSTYARARQLVIPLYEDRALELALNTTPGVVKTKRQALTKDGEVVTLEEERTDDAVERARLGLSAYQWVLGWMVPKKHGKQPDVNPNGKNEQLESLFAALKSGPVV